MAELITGVYYNRAAAEEAVDKLENLGYERGEINVIMHDRTRAKEFAESTGTTAGSAHRAADAAKSAVKVGGALAAILAGVAAVGAARHEKSDDRTSTTLTSTDRSSTTGISGEAGSYRVGSDVPTPLNVESGTGLRGETTVPASTSTGNSSESSTNLKPFIAGPLAAILLPALGAGLISAFSKAGIPKEHAERYAQALESGGVVVGVQARAENEGRVRQTLSA